LAGSDAPELPATTPAERPADRKFIRACGEYGATAAARPCAREGPRQESASSWPGKLARRIAQSRRARQAGEESPTPVDFGRLDRHGFQLFLTSWRDASSAEQPG